MLTPFIDDVVGLGGDGGGEDRHAEGEFGGTPGDAKSDLCGLGDFGAVVEGVGVGFGDAVLGSGYWCHFEERCEVVWWCGEVLVDVSEVR